MGDAGSNAVPTGDAWDSALANVTPGGRQMIGRRVSLGVVVWIVVGVIVAARDGFLDNLGSLSGVLSAILAVAVWPLVLLDVHFGI